MVETDIPVLDVAAFEAAEPAERAELGKTIDRTFREVGFLTIVGHGVASEVIEEAERTARQFFAMPEDRKRQAFDSKQFLNRGYLPWGANAASRTKGGAAPPDLKEAFIVGPPKAPDAGSTAPFTPNVWPDGPPGFRNALERYYAALEKLAFRMMRIFATALDLPENFFPPFFTAHNCIVRVQFYPALKAAPLPGQLRIGAHTDYGAFTILRVKEKKGSPGLQAQTRRGEWLDIVPRDDSFVINLGDLMHTWTNDRWQSNLHRVINPAEGSPHNVDRLSLPFFVNPNYDALIDCIPTCLGPGETPRHAPILAGEHRLQQFKKTNSGYT